MKLKAKHKLLSLGRSSVLQGTTEHFVLNVNVMEAGKMGEHKDLSEFNKGQIAKTVGHNISKTAALVAYFQSSVCLYLSNLSKEETEMNQ